jgi:hypothetical protein
MEFITFGKKIKMQQEIWKDIKGYEGKYQVSSIGRVKSLQRISTFNNSKGLKKEIIIKTWNDEGYIRVKLSNNSVEKTYRVHRLVANEFLENPFNKSQVNHKNGIKTDNSVENLEWVTNSENSIHAFENNLRKSPLGSNHGNSKLNEQKVLEIRKIGRSKSLKEIADIYCVDKSLISLILRNKAWKHV